MKMLRVALTGLVLSVSGIANAGLIEFIYTGTGTGTIGGQAFNNSFITITEYSDTDQIQSCGPTCVYINSITSTVSIDNVGSFEFITDTRTFNNNGRLGFSRSSGADLFNIFDVGSFDMASALAPVAGTPSFLQWSRTPVDTTGGVLSFDDARTSGTFEARLSTVPEPTTLAIFALGIIGLASRKLKKQ